MHGGCSLCLELTPTVHPHNVVHIDGARDWVLCPHI
jgi:hypothetical protein